jgi:hypothetical protein
MRQAKEMHLTGGHLTSAAPMCARHTMFAFRRRAVTQAAPSIRITSWISSFVVKCALVFLSSVGCK